MRNPKGRYAETPMPMGCLYLNNDGSFGNFATTEYRYKGKRYGGLAKSHDGSELRDDTATGDNALPHIFHEKSGLRSR